MSDKEEDEKKSIEPVNTEIVPLTNVPRITVRFHNNTQGTVVIIFVAFEQKIE